MSAAKQASLTDRYLHAVLAHVPAARRQEIHAELRHSIARSVADRVIEGQSVVDAERSVLAEFGDPMRVSATYTGRQLQLIGPAVYPDYVRLLRLLLIIVVPVVGVVIGVVAALSGADLWSIVTAGFGTAFTVGVQVAFWVTVVFALVDRYRARTGATASTWDLDDLPELPGSGITLGGTIGSVAGLAVLAWLLLWQPGYQESFDPGGPSIPILDPALGRFWIPFLVGVLLASIALEIVKYLIGRWTVTLAVINTVLTLAFALPFLWLASTDQVLNPVLVSTVTVEGAPSAVGSLPVIIACVIIVVSAIDVSEGWWKALRPTDRILAPAGESD